MTRWALFAGALAACTGACRSGTDAGRADAGTTMRASVPVQPAPNAARAMLDAGDGPGIAYATMTRDGDAPGAIGLSDVAGNVPATADTPFEAASIAKTLIATCVMQLVEQGRLDLDVDVARYLGFAVRHPRSSLPITVRMLLTHRASIRDVETEIDAPREGHPLGAFLADYFARPEAGPRRDAFVDALPDTSLVYSNVGASLAALVVERITGESFDVWTTRKILGPLRMTRTSWTAPSLLSVATPHARSDGGFAALAQASHALYPVVDLRSSAGDLARFARAILREGELDGARILAPDSVRHMLRASSETGAGAEQALAWQWRVVGRSRVVGHEGEDRGASSALFLDPAAGTGAVILVNGDAFGSNDPTRAAAFHRLLTELLATAH